MYITVAYLSSLIWSARQEGYDDGLRDALKDVQTNSACQGDMNLKPENPEPETDEPDDTCTDCGKPLTNEDLAYEQGFEDGFDSGYDHGREDIAAEVTAVL